MADTISAIPQLITASADGLSHEIEFDGGEFGVLLAEYQVAFITVISGTFKFNIGPCSETNATYTAEKVEPLPFINGVKNIQYQATTGGTFRISVCRDVNN